jgi:imidazolonepropionase-like amidohydrolase
VRFVKSTKRSAAASLFFIGASVSLWSCSRSGPSALAITNVTLIDGTGSLPQPDMTVVISDWQVVAIAPSKSANIPRHEQILDATGKFLVPGLADMHVHLTGSGEPTGSRESILPLLLANGITTVRDMGGYLESLTPLRREIEEGKRLAPEIFFAGPYLDGNPPSFQPSLVVSNSTEAAESVHTLVGRGVDFIKVQSILGREAYFGIADVCRSENITFVGHVPDGVTAAEASDAGQKSIEHLTGVLRACSTDEPRLMHEQIRNGNEKETPARSHARELASQRELLQTYSDQAAAKLIAKFARNQTWQTPTLILLRNIAFPTPENDPSADPLARYVPRTLMAKWQIARQGLTNAATKQEFALRKALLQKSIQLLGKMQSEGVPILAGTDTGAPLIFPGSALHEELALLVQAGLTPMQALQAATKNPADFLRKPGRKGTVEPGQAANLLLLDANPLDDIHNTQRIRAVILHGKLLDRPTLDKVLSSVEKFATTH